MSVVEGEADGCAAAGTLLGEDDAAVGLGYGAHHGQAEARAGQTEARAGQTAPTTPANTATSYETWGSTRRSPNAEQSTVPDWA